MRAKVAEAEAASPEALEHMREELAQLQARLKTAGTCAYDVK